MHLNKTELQPTEAQAMKAVILDRLAKGEILLLVDGLDEISDRSVRQMFCQELECTAVRYPGAPILVTSRIVGYRDMPDRMRTGFAHGVISDLHPETKNLFARRWVEVTEAHQAKADREASAQDLIAAVHSTDRIERLTGNPMLLTTMALVKRKVGKLPTRRIKLYAEAVSVLLNWNPKVYTPIEEEEALPQLAFLAYEMCRRGVQRLTGEEVLDLLDQLRADYPKIRAVRRRDSQAFLHLLEQRSGLLMRSGVQWQPNHSQEKAIWEFRHLTFQEYLAAHALNEGYYMGRDSNQSLAEQVAPLAAPVRQQRPEAPLSDNGVEAVPDSWREALRLLVSDCSYDDVDEVLLSILKPGPGEEAAATQGPRAILASQCLADEPNVDDATAREVLTRFVALIGENDGLAGISSSVEATALEVWRSHLDHRAALQACLLEAFAKVPPETAAYSSGPHCGAVLAQLLGASLANLADGPDGYLEAVRTSLGSPDDGQAIIAALQVLEHAYLGLFCQHEELAEGLLALVDRGGAPAHAAAWALAWLSVDPEPAANPRPPSRNRLLPPLNSQRHGPATAIGWRPSQSAVAALLRALEQARAGESDLKRHLIGLLGLASEPDLLPPLLARLDDPAASVRVSVRDALARLAQGWPALSPSLLAALQAELNKRLLRNGALVEEERAEGLLLLALFGVEELLRQLLADDQAPVILRRRAAEGLGLLASRCDVGDHRQRIEAFLEAQLRADALDLLVEGEEGWAEHDRRLPLLQGAARALQLAASADLPLLGSGPGLEVPMLTLTALQEGEALRIRTEVVTPAVWRLPLPGGEQLELVLVPGGEYGIGSPKEEEGRDVYPLFRQKCEGVDVEAQRTVNLKDFVLVRHPITQAQWRAVASLPQQERKLNPTPGRHKPDDLWERFAQPGGLAVDSVSWHDCQEWLRRLNSWLLERWSELGGQGEAPQLALPSESQWEVACRAGASTPFHFGATLDVSWANYKGVYIYGPGREGLYRNGRVSVGFFGLVNRWGLAEMHGQLWEWCGDQWQRDPVSGAAGDGSALEGPDPELEGNQEQTYRLLRGGSWIGLPHFARAAFRISNLPGNANPLVGVRPGCFSPPGLLLSS
jgi:formylglycine-generating enzyme required for sulfatase activity